MKINISSIRFPDALNKDVKKDDDGYYYLTLGAFNVHNSAGDFYTDKGIREMFNDKASTLMRRINGRYLKAELNHPKFENGMTREQFIQRNLNILEERVCAHIKSIELVDTDIPSGLQGHGNVIMVKGWVKPMGTYGAQLKEQLDDPNVNVAFSVRSFTNDTINPNTGRYIKTIFQIITYDWVPEPGISHANKFDTVSAETYDIPLFDLDDVSIGDEVSMCVKCGLESQNEVDMLVDTIKRARAVETNNKNSFLTTW